MCVCVLFMLYKDVSGGLESFSYHILYGRDHHAPCKHKQASVLKDLQQRLYSHPICNHHYHID